MDVRWSVFFTHFAIVLPCFFHLTATFKQQGSCYFPKRWEGTWFQSGVRQPIIIDGSRLSSKGRCLGSEGDKFLVVDDKRACYRCVVIHEKHANVLQYKETFCHSRDSLPTLCSLITGDALLFSMFRENAAAVPCPFRGPFTFTYNRGHGECRTPVSSIDTCTEDNRLLLSYQACPDVYGSESTVEELECLATWKEGSSRYLVGKVHHNHATSNEDRFRCFVYEKASAASEAMDGVDYRVAQSGDATCNGLFSATEGSRTMILKRAPSLNKCRFPSWVANYNHWHNLDYSATYSFHHRNSTLRITNSSGLEMKVVCAQLLKSPFIQQQQQQQQYGQQQYLARDENSVVLLTHFTMGCQSGFTCMAFYRRDLHVMEVQIGAHTKRQDDACNPAYFNWTTLPYVTLVTSSPETRPCPYTGKFHISNFVRNDRLHDAGNNKNYNQLSSRSIYNHHRLSVESNNNDNNDMMMMTKRMKRVDQDYDCDSSATTSSTTTNTFRSLVIGCNSIDTMEFRTDDGCPSSDLITAYSCHGGWKENGTNYLITTPLSRTQATSSLHGAKRYCFVYKDFVENDNNNNGGGIVLFSTTTSNCDRVIRPGRTGELIFNVTSTGKCIETSGVARSVWSTSLVSLFLIIFHILKFALIPR